MRGNVSVVIPTFNGAGFVEEALASVFAQTLRPCEIIVIDDCSRDGTREVAASVARAAPVPVRVIALDVNSGGPARPLNVGIAAARGEFIAVLDQDDVFAPTKLEDQVGCLAHHPELTLVFSLCGRFDQPDRPMQGPHVLTALRERMTPAGDCDRLPGVEALRLFLAHGNFILGYPGMVFRKKHWERKGGLDESLPIGSDFDFFCWLCLQGGAGFIDGIGYWRRLHARNMCNQNQAMLIDWYRVLARYLTAEPGVLQDGTLSPYLHDRIFDLAYLLRQQGQYREALGYYRLSLRAWGWRSRTLKAIAKLPAHWARRTAIVSRLAASLRRARAARSPEARG
jgi:glycosyltransferase involved in cell wall biosynthesis